MSHLRRNDLDPAIRTSLTPFLERLQEAGAPLIVRENFAYYFGLLYSGHTGYIGESELDPVMDLPNADDFGTELQQLGRESYTEVVQIKLNGGLGTGMGLEKAKSLLQVKDGHSFLDILAKQSIASGVPLILMNSGRTRDDSLATLAKFPDLPGDLPRDFVQNMIPKVLQRSLTPAKWAPDPSLEWNPPGHGDLYSSIYSSGLLDTLLDKGYAYAFVSNADNLGAVIDPGLLGYMIQARRTFLMEVADRTPADRKGGHLAQRKSGAFVLRESAQTQTEDQDSFQDITRHKYFNTNNIWVHLPTLRSLIHEQRGILGLPLIRNNKTLDPRDPDSPAVFQIETAIGAAVEVFTDAGAVRVPRTRFAPVKSTNDLLAVRSNLYQLAADFRVLPNPARQLGPILIDLDPAYYKLIDQFESRFPDGPPDLLTCESITVRGDVRFTEGLILRGQVDIENQNPVQIALKSGTPIQGQIRLER